MQNGTAREVSERNERRRKKENHTHKKTQL
jgi:hypothetical protein